MKPSDDGRSISDQASMPSFESQGYFRAVGFKSLSLVFRFNIVEFGSIASICNDNMDVSAKKVTSGAFAWIGGFKTDQPVPARASENR